MVVVVVVKILVVVIIVIERQGPLTLNLTELLKQQRQLVLCGNCQLSNGQLANPIHYRPPVPVAGHSVQKSLSQD